MYQRKRAWFARSACILGVDGCIVLGFSKRVFVDIVVVVVVVVVVDVSAQGH